MELKPVLLLHIKISGAYVNVRWLHRIGEICAYEAGRPNIQYFAHGINVPHIIIYDVWFLKFRNIYFLVLACVIECISSHTIWQLQRVA